MIALRQHDLPRELHATCLTPFKLIDYKNSPELINEWYFPSYNSELADLEVNFFGDISLNYKKYFHTRPHIYVRKLQDVILYYGHVYSKFGGLFIDSPRHMTSLREENLFNNFLIGQPYYLGGGYYCIPESPKCMSLDIIPEHSMVISTLNAYGHYLTEYCSLLWVFDHGIAPEKLIIHHDVKDIPKYVYEMGIPFGVNPDMFKIAPRPAILKNVYLPTRSLMLRKYITDMAKYSFRKIAEYYHFKEKNTIYEKIYVSRKYIQSNTSVLRHLKLMI
jgi:hypothetical protein